MIGCYVGRGWLRLFGRAEVLQLCWTLFSRVGGEQEM
jgi:hypothetical protein